MAAKLEIEMARVPKKPAAKRSVKRGVRNPVAALTKTHAAATKKVATAQKALDRAIARRAESRSQIGGCNCEG